MATRTRSTLTDIYQSIMSGKDALATSLPNYTRSVNLVSKMYMEQSIAQDDIAIPLSATLTQIYTGFVLTAVNLNQYVTGGKTVRGMVANVSTENHVDVLEMVKNHFGTDKNISVSMEAGGAGPVVDMDKVTSRMAAGKVIAVDFSVDGADGKKSTLSVYLNCQLLPQLITKAVSEAIIKEFNPPTNKMRMQQVKTGEIKFLQDFIMCRDLIADRKKALKEDDTGVLFEISQANKNKLFKQLVGYVVGEQRHNLDNTIMVMEASSLKQATTVSHLNMDNYPARQKLFAKTGMMMIVSVDTMYNLVDIYYNGLQHKGTYDFNTINTMGGGKKEMDMKQLLNVMSNGAAPRF